MSGIEPCDTFEYDLDADGDSPADEHRVLVYQHGTARHWLRHSREAERLRACREVVEEGYLTALEAHVATGLVGWRGFARGYAADVPLGEVLSFAELEHLSQVLPYTARVSEIEKKGLRLRSRPSSEMSAPDADQASADGTSVARNPSSDVPVAAAETNHVVPVEVVANGY